ncbi:aminoglycoside phosphotransferase family protein [Brachybacterium sp. YJGR34]|uniref:aminoglycoside phosphotransferase family protein n=1 Tax=Brachybacterium sp. YJGR34 TaxID=2059911 RepID=UPI000E0B1BE2|nr:aminoglycoside phosphotransferase family protein [Brachybacterium sp. YJGR34]
MPLHVDELTVTTDQVRALLQDQAPQFAGEEITALEAGGTVNTIYRVGEEATARFPRQAHAPAADAERWLREDAERMALFAAVSPVPGPRTLVVGRPGHGVPMPWNLQTWLPGTVASPRGHREEISLAEDLAALITSLRAVDVTGRRFTGPGRGGTLRAHDDWVRDCLARSEGLLETAPLRAQWERLRELPAPPRLALCHTDLIPANLLVAGGRLVGVLDTGGTRPADPALDLVAAWHLFDEGAREHLRSALGCGDEEWERGRGWAFEQAIGLVWYYDTSHPAMAELGRSTLARLVAAAA